MAEPVPKSVLFVCLGNICRSPIAEAVFRKLVNDQNVSDKWRIDSAATSTYEIGNPPDYRGQNCMKKHDVPMNHIARQKVAFSYYDYFMKSLLCTQPDETMSRDGHWHFRHQVLRDSVVRPAGLEIIAAHDTENVFGSYCFAARGLDFRREITKEDFATFDYILCMDESNLRDLNRKSNQVKNCKAKIELLGSYDPQKQTIIEDPYYGNDADFETVYQQCLRCCRAFLEKVD